MEKAKIKIRKKAYTLEKNVKLEGDNIIPDIKPDIISVVGENGELRIQKETVQKEKIKIEGKWQGNVLYVSDSGEIKVVEYSFNLFESFENNQIKENDTVVVKNQVIKVDSNILNERKISNEIELKIIIEGYRDEEEEFISKLDDDENIQKLEKNVQIKKLVSSVNSKSVVSEEINFLQVRFRCRNIK